MSSDTLPVAVDIGGTKIAVAYRNDSGFQSVDRFPTPADPEEAVRLIADTIRTSTGDTVIGALGIGAPGPLDSHEGKFLTPPNLPSWHGFPITRKIEAELGIPVRLENDANLGALGEAVDGSGRGLRSMFYFTISTGIGSGLIIDGRIHSGRKGMAGELWAFRPGHFNGSADGPTVMDLASGPGLLRRTQYRIEQGDVTSLDLSSLDTPGFLTAALNGDSLALSVLEEARDAVAALLIATIETLAPEAVVLGGGLCTDDRWFVGPLRSRIQRYCGIPELADTPVRRAELWDNAVLYGALAYVEELCR